MDPLEIIIYLSIGVAAAILGALMGVGGGFLMVPIFIFMGFNTNYGNNLLAPVLSLFIIIFIALSASVKYSYKKTINYRLGLLFAPFSIIGSLVGTRVLDLIGKASEGALIFKILFSILIVVMGIRLIYKYKKTNSETLQLKDKMRSHYWAVPWGFLTGFSASIVGIGGGLIAVPALHLFFLETMHVAIGTSLFIMIFTASFATLFNYFIYTSLLDVNFFFAGIVVAVGAIIGAQLGSYIQTHLKGPTLQLIFGTFMIGIAIPLLWLGP